MKKINFIFQNINQRNKLVINIHSNFKEKNRFQMNSHITSSSKYSQQNQREINTNNYRNQQHSNNDNNYSTQQFNRQLLKNNDSQSNLIHQQYETNHLNSSKMSKKSHFQNKNHSQIQLGIEKVSQLTERLKNIHHFYKIRIQEEKTKNVERNQVFMSIIQELQNSHNKKIQQLKRQIADAEEQNKQVGLVDYKMVQIKGSIDDILKQSSHLKNSNQKFQNQLAQKQKIIKTKYQECQRLKKDVMEYRTQLQNFQRMKLKQNKKNRQMLEMIDNIITTRNEK